MKPSQRKPSEAMPFFKKNHSLHRQKPLKNNTAMLRQFHWVSAKALLVLSGGEPGAGGSVCPQRAGLRRAHPTLLSEKVSARL